MYITFSSGLKITVSDGDVAGMRQRDKKGNSLLNFPSDYVVIDIETTGLDPLYDDIIEVSAIRYTDNVMSDQYVSLVKPENPISDFIANLTGVTNEMVSCADPIETVLPQFLNFIGSSPLVGHNIHFDINFIYDRSMDILNKPFSNDFSDTLRLSRRLLPDLKNHKLTTLADKLNIDTNGMHRAFVDCNITNAVYQYCRETAVNQYGSVDAFVEYVKKSSHYSVNAKDIKTENTIFDVTHPLYNKTCVFTGKLDRFVRKDAMQAVVDLGGKCGNNVTKDTDFLILGNNDYCSSIKDGKSSKHKKAEKMKLSGSDIEIITENIFYEMLTY